MTLYAESGGPNTGIFAKDVMEVWLVEKRMQADRAAQVVALQGPPGPIHQALRSFNDNPGTEPDQPTQNA